MGVAEGVDVSGRILVGNDSDGSDLKIASASWK